MARSSDYSDLGRAVDGWLWIPYRQWLARWHQRSYRARNLEACRRRVRVAMRVRRAREQERATGRLIRSIYWHEVHHPTIPVRQYH